MEMNGAGLIDQRKLIDLVLERESGREKVRHRSYSRSVGGCPIATPETTRY
jgi:hypothetical protein